MQRVFLDHNLVQTTKTVDSTTQVFGVTKRKKGVDLYAYISDVITDLGIGGGGDSLYTADGTIEEDREVDFDLSSASVKFIGTDGTKTFINGVRNDFIAGFTFNGVTCVNSSLPDVTIYTGIIDAEGTVYPFMGSSNFSTGASHSIGFDGKSEMISSANNNEQTKLTLTNNSITQILKLSSTDSIEENWNEPLLGAGGWRIRNRVSNQDDGGSIRVTDQDVRLENYTANSLNTEVKLTSSQIQVKGEFNLTDQTESGTAGSITTYITITVNGNPYKLPLYAVV